MTEILAGAVKVKCAVHAGGLVGGVGVMAVRLDELQSLLAEPEGRGLLVEAISQRIHGELQAANIFYGLREEDIAAIAEDFADAVAAGSSEPLTRRVAHGDDPVPAGDGYIEYCLNHRGMPFAELSSLKPGSPLKKRTVVQAGDTLAVEHPPTPAEDGTSVRGDRLPAASEVRVRCLTEVAGPRTIVAGDRLQSECDGLCEEDAEGWLRVVPEILLHRVDRTTGRIPAAGIGEANVAVVEGISDGPGVATTETVFVGAGPQEATIEGHVSVQARDLVVHGAALGNSDASDGTIELSGTFVAREVRNRTVQASRILIAEDSHFASLDAEQEIRVDGNLRGGRIRCGHSIEVGGDLGTLVGGSHTVILLPAEAGAKRRAQRVVVLAGRHRAAVADLRQQLEVLARRAQKRAKVDDYWATLLEGERPPPQGPIQNRTLATFVEFHEQQTGLERRLQAEERAAAKLAESEPSKGDEQPTGITVNVGGTVHTDVTFEVSRVMQEEDAALAVAFTLEGEHLTGKSLADVRAHLLRQVAAYREQQGEYLEERRKSLEALHKGQAHKPEPPKMEDCTYRLDFTWEGAGESTESFALAAEVSVRALQPERFIVRSTARLKAASAGVTVQVGSSGALGTFQMHPNPGAPAPWRADGEVREALDQLVVYGISAADLLAGNARIHIEALTGHA